jgi:hypothetical protein
MKSCDFEGGKGKSYIVGKGRGASQMCPQREVSAQLYWGNMATMAVLDSVLYELLISSVFGYFSICIESVY